MANKLGSRFNPHQEHCKEHGEAIWKCKEDEGEEAEHSRWKATVKEQKARGKLSRTGRARF